MVVAVVVVAVAVVVGAVVRAVDVDVAGVDAVRVYVKCNIEVNVNAWTDYASPWGRCLYTRVYHVWTSIPSQEYGLVCFILFWGIFLARDRNLPRKNNIRESFPERSRVFPGLRI